MFTTHIQHPLEAIIAKALTILTLICSSVSNYSILLASSSSENLSHHPIYKILHATNDLFHSYTLYSFGLIILASLGLC